MGSSLWDLITNIKNGQLAKKVYIFQKQKKNCEAVLKKLWDEGFILGYKFEQGNLNRFQIFLKYNKNKPVITQIQCLSKPGLKTYYCVKQLWKIDSTKFFLIISTSKGLKTLTECKKLKIGGEPVVVIN